MVYILFLSLPYAILQCAMAKSWTEAQLRKAAKQARSIREIIKALGLRPAGGNYDQITKYLKAYHIDTSHLKGRGWSRGMKGLFKPSTPLERILVKRSDYQSYKLKKRLFLSGKKKQTCEECGWAERSKDGRVPLELDHINGDARDNRLENLRILCPNCHSLKPTHRGRNIKKKPR